RGSMRFLDPLPTTCVGCSAKSPQRVADLLSLRARCPACGASLGEVGRRMRALLDEAGTVFSLVEIALGLEDGQGVTISNAELEGVTTLRQLAAAVQRHLPPGPESEQRSVELVTAAARQSSSCRAEELPLDASILDALSPDRWKVAVDPGANGA